MTTCPLQAAIAARLVALGYHPDYARNLTLRGAPLLNTFHGHLCIDTPAQIDEATTDLLNIVNGRPDPIDTPS